MAIIDNIFDFKNPMQGVLCNENIDFYNSIARDINSKYRNSMDLINAGVGTVSDLIGDYEYTKRNFPNVKDTLDLNSIEFNKPSMVGLAECLTKNIPFTGGSFGMLDNLLKNAKSIFTDAIKAVMDYLKPVADFAAGIFNFAVEQLNWIMGKIETAFEMILDPVASTLFKALDKINEWVSKLDISADLQKIQNIGQCLMEYCGNNDKLIDISNARDNLPIDMYTGEFRPYKMINNTETLDKMYSLDKDYRARCDSMSSQFEDIANTSLKEKISEKFRIDL